MNIELGCEYALSNHNKYVNSMIQKNTILKKFKLDPKYEHKLSSGMTRRNNAGTKYQKTNK